MIFEFDIHEGKLIIDLVQPEEQGDVVIAHGELSIENIFDEMYRIREERRVEDARAASLAGEIRAGRKVAR